MLNTSNRISLRSSLLNALLVLACGVATAGCDRNDGSDALGKNVQLLSEGFESDPWGVRWQRAGACAQLEDAAAAGTGSTKGVRMRRACWVHTVPPIRTVGYQNVRVRFDYRMQNLAQDERVIVQWSLDGTAWNTIKGANDTLADGGTPGPREWGSPSYAWGTPNDTSGWANATVTLPAPSAGAEQLYVRIELYVNGGDDEQVDLDNLTLLADPIDGCNHASLCTAAVAQCGTIIDPSCGDVPCDPQAGCSAGETCVANRCEQQLDCSPKTRCAGANAQCGVMFHPTCGDIDCTPEGGCGDGNVCTDNRCVPECSPAAVCASALAECGTIVSPACGELSCGSCGAGETCKTEGTVNTCDKPCTALKCSDIAATCGDVPDGCGGSITCGARCADGQVCSADFQCVVPGCEPANLPAGSVGCRPLSASELAQMQTHLTCSEGCRDGRLADRSSCLAKCPTPSAAWDKNRDARIDQVDLDLARLEAGDASKVCYENGAVVPSAACGAGDCQNTRANPTVDCVDADGDGLWAWQEQMLGTGDSDETRDCGETRQCGSFADACRYDVRVNRHLCLARVDCDGSLASPCTAFHLERVSVDNGELIVRVHFDHAPTDVSVLDLYLNYESSAMTLTDARPLAALRNTDKALSVRHFSDTQLRVVVLGSSNTVPIPTGPIAELVFTRVSSRQTSLAFSTSDFLQQWSIAPNPGEARLDLTVDSLWGDDVEIPVAVPSGPRMLLYYSFDNTQHPMDVNLAPDAERLCVWSVTGGDQGCPSVLAAQSNPNLGEERAARVAQYGAMQRGTAQFSESIEGVNGKAARLDGNSDHLELPVTLEGTDGSFAKSDQDFSFSAWFFVDSSRYDGDTRQILFSHNSPASERTAMAFAARPTSAGAFDLEWIDGDVTTANPVVSPVAQGLASDRWYHVAFTFDARTSGNASLQFFVDGQQFHAGRPTTDAQQALSVSLNNAWQCPSLSSGRIQIHEEGRGVPGGQSPDQIFFASARSNLHGIEVMDTTGLARRELVRAPESSAKDPSYNPNLDKLLYASSASGSYEIWIANGDGSNPRRVTQGFGDTARGIFARRPKWDPNGHGFVFESNIYSVLDAYNVGRTNQLYYVPYDPTGGVAVRYASGESNELVFERVVDEEGEAGKFNPHRLTNSGKPASHFYRVSWLRGGNGASDRGAIVATKADERYDNPKVIRIELGVNNDSSVITTVDPWAARPDPNAVSPALSVLAAAQGVGRNTPTRMLLQREWVEYMPADQFSLSTETVSGKAYATVTYRPTGYDPRSCWDLDGDGVFQPVQNQLGIPEDRNGDGQHSVDDCHANSVSNLYLSLKGLEPTRTSSNEWAFTSELSSSKDVAIERVQIARVGAFVKIDVFSSADPTPMEAGIVIARIPLTGDASLLGTMAISRRTAREQLYHLSVPAAGFELPEGVPTFPIAVQLPKHFERVLDAGFNPEGDRIVVSVLENARPVVVVSDRMFEPDGRWAGGFDVVTPDAATGSTLGSKVLQIDPSAVSKVSQIPTGVEGLQWVSVNRAYPCNWVGAFREPSSKRYLHAFRGGLDEIKLHSYLRSQGAFRSETERGHERLAISQPNGPELEGTACGNSFDCSDYQLCVAGHCETRDCAPSEPYSCSEGACTLMPVPNDADGADTRWVCSVECSLDNECFQQECLNGPCRFCSPTDTCVECQPTLNALDVLTYEGCPDTNAFACVEGSCVTECYTFENGVSTYLCDAATEYCFQGRCRLFDWSWSDFAPATFAGLGETTFKDHPHTIAVPELYPVEVWAYGVRDYLHQPEVFVQAQSPGLYDGDQWFDLGRFLVYNQTEAEANKDLNRHVLQSPYPITRLRFQLIQPPMENMANSATGLTGLGRDGDFCQGALPFQPTDKNVCFRRESASEPIMGYGLGIPRWQADTYWSCQQTLDEDGNSKNPGACAPTDPLFTQYLAGGNAAAVITRIKVNLTDVALTGATKNTICRYGDGTRDRADALGQGTHLAMAHPSGAQTLLDLTQVTPRPGYALLNCPYSEPNGGAAAELVLPVSVNFPDVSKGDVAYGKITENANGCLVAIDPKRSEPCYEWVGAAPSLDPYTDVMVPFRTLELQDFTSFGYDP